MTESERRDLVEALAGYGLPAEDIASLVGIKSDRVLRDKYAPLLALGEAKANSKVVEALYNQALNGNITAQIYWTKARCGWSDKPQNAAAGSRKPSRKPQEPPETQADLATKMRLSLVK